jgi:hypothetical protein
MAHASREPEVPAVLDNLSAPPKVDEAAVARPTLYLVIDKIFLAVLSVALISGLGAIVYGGVSQAEGDHGGLRVAHLVLSGALLCTCACMAWYRGHRDYHRGAAHVDAPRLVITGALGAVVLVLAFAAPGVLGTVFQVVTWFM